MDSEGRERRLVIPPGREVIWTWIRILKIPAIFSFGPTTAAATATAIATTTAQLQLQASNVGQIVQYAGRFCPVKIRFWFTAGSVKAPELGGE